MPPRPVRVRTRMYQVGFGDCFLLSFEYQEPPGEDGRRNRHVLIDFGSSRLHDDFTLVDVAKLIAQHCEGRLDAIVVSHRHKDHLSGFAHDASAKVIAGLRPSLIVRPWTEDPDLPNDARGPLVSIDRVAHSIMQAIPEKTSGLYGQIRRLADGQIKNEEAVLRLNEWAKPPAQAAYANVGRSCGLEKLLPGVDVTVLGPPTIEQWSKVKSERRTHPEYWMLLARALEGGDLSLMADRFLSAEGGPDSPAAASPPGPEHWFIERMQRQRAFALRRIVRAMDDYLNNTSLILLFEIADMRLLFPGDAQLENWQYVLEQFDTREPLLEKLARIDLYKVGHHGSRNATPRRSLFGPWQLGGSRRLTSLVSTKSGVHGETARTRVPRATLLKALGQLGPVHSTEDFKSKQAYLELVADVGAGGGFRVVA